MAASKAISVSDCGDCVNFSECEQLLAEAAEHLQNGQRDVARAAYVRAVTVNPRSTAALSRLAQLLAEDGDLPGALDALHRLRDMHPEIPELSYNIGSILLDLGRAAEAREALEQAVALNPAMVPAHNTLGLALQQLGAHEDSVESFEAALRHAPDHLPALANLGTALVNLRRADRALEVCRRAVELSRHAPDCCFSLGLACDLAGHRDDAIRWLREATERCPERDDWRFHLAAVSQSDPPAAAPADFIASLFDGYAARFDRHMQADLQCRIPELIRAAVCHVAPDRKFDVLDLGCGTGLSGETIQPIAQRLTGVDLSAEMIRLARARNIYEELHQADNASYLATCSSRFDLVIAADVLLYTGDLSDVFRLTRSVLTPAGLFAFSVEAVDTTAESRGYHLDPARRYRHARSYLQALAAEHGFREVSARRDVLRVHSGRDVVGWIVVLAAESPSEG